MQKIIPCLWFDIQAEEAASFYVSLFEDSKIVNITRYGEAGPRPAGTVLTVDFELAGQQFIGLNGGPEYSFTPAISMFVSCDSEAEVDRLFEKLSDGGTVYMELGEYPFSKRFGWVGDRYGLTWQLMLGARAQKIAPKLMFVREQAGKATQAMELYTSLFKDSGILDSAHFSPGTGEPETNVSQAEFVLAGEEFMAMDSSAGHQFTFTPAFSLFVNCEDQQEVDRLWEQLTRGGMEVQCGWLQDRYGVSWQIVPTILGKLLQDKDPVKAQRVMQAMLQMKKIEVDGLMKAYEGGG